MKIEDVIATKGTNTVLTIAPTASCAELVRTLADKNIGALVVSADGSTIEGIVSERDVVRGLAERGSLDGSTVADLMTREVHTAEPAHTVEDAAGQMTQFRIRHMPVVVDGAMVGLVSIGDVVKHRIAQLTDERNHLLGYLHG